MGVTPRIQVLTELLQGPSSSRELTALCARRESTLLPVIKSLHSEGLIRPWTDPEDEIWEVAEPEFVKKELWGATRREYRVVSKYCGECPVVYTAEPSDKTSEGYHMWTLTDPRDGRSRTISDKVFELIYEEVE